MHESIRDLYDKVLRFDLDEGVNRMLKALLEAAYLQGKIDNRKEFLEELRTINSHDKEDA